MPKSLVARVRLIYFVFDLVLSVLIPLAFVNCIEPADWTYALIVLYALGLVRTAGINIMFGRVLGPIARWIESASTLPDSREVRDIDGMIRRAPTAVTLWISVLWAGQLVIATLVLLLFDRYHAGIAPRSLITALLMA